MNLMFIICVISHNIVLTLLKVYLLKITTKYSMTFNPLIINIKSY
jgi:hypothetical protein